MRTARRPRGLLPRGERGIGLMEVIVATVIATVAVLALAYNFGTARGLLGRFELARVGLAAAQKRMELLSVLPPTDPSLAIGSTHQQIPVVVAGATVAYESWTVAAWHDPLDPVTGATDLKLVTVTVTWGDGTPAQSVQLTRFFPLF